MQIDNTLILTTKEFNRLKKDKIVKAKLIVKLKKKLLLNTPLLFKGYTVLSNNSRTIYL